MRPDAGKCLRYYFYFIDGELGPIYVRVPTWAPFRLQVYCNGHGWLARKLTAEGIGFTAEDNALPRIGDWERAQELADGFSPMGLHRILDRYAALCCPVLDAFKQSYRWSPMQVEYSTDPVFRSKATLAPLYGQLARHSVLTVKAETIATFLGRKLSPALAQEIGSQFSTRIEGTCIEHRFGKSSIKMYDKSGIVLRIGTTTGDVSSFKHGRKVEHRKGPSSTGFAPMKKTVYSLGDLAGILFACNRRYLAHLSALDDFSAGVKLLERVTRPRTIDGKTVKGVDFFNPTNAPCLARRGTPSSTSPAFAARTSLRFWISFRLRGSRVKSAACVTWASSSALPKPTATTSPAQAEPLSPPPLTSLNTASFPHSRDGFRAQSDKIWLVRD